MDIYFKYKSEVMVVCTSSEETLGSLKSQLEALTAIKSSRMKLIGLKPPKAMDDTVIGDLDLSSNSSKKPIMLLGTPEAAHASLQREIEALPQVQEAEDDESDGEDEGPSTTNLIERPDIVAKLETRYARANIVQLNPPKKGKCVVFDIDYTFFDLGGTSERPEELLRPYTKEFMAHVYNLGFDIVIWSANSMKWITVKLRELGLVGDGVPFKITACMDYTAMVTMSSSELGDERKRKRRSATFDCKPLAVLWHRFKDFYHPSTTIMLDDLRRNFILNKQQGLVIKPFRNATTSGRDDREFRRLKEYFTILGQLNSFEDCNHDEWKTTTT